MSSKILSLVRPELNTDSHLTLHYTVSRFPDGQQAITITSKISPSDVYEVEIQSRLNSFKDLELIVCAAQSLREMGITRISLYVPYFLGARSDRRFLEGSCNYLKTVICPIINLQGFSKVTVMDPHSNVLEACLTNYNKANSYQVVKFALDNLDFSADNLAKSVYLVSPDAGALKKTYRISELFGIPNIIFANKHRDVVTGKIIKTEVPGIPTGPQQYQFIITDDICDTGGTFIEVAKAIRKSRPRELGYTDKVYLLVTHGIFSKGFADFPQYIDGIFCTNSVKDIQLNEVAETKINLKQLNVF